MTVHDGFEVASPRLGEQDAHCEVDRVGVTELRSEMGGRWEVTARTSRHVWDLDAMRYTRTPGPAATQMVYDGVAVPIGRVAVWPVVGQQSLLFYDDPNDPSTEHYRACSTIESITAMPAVDPGEQVMTGQGPQGALPDGPPQPT